MDHDERDTVLIVEDDPDLVILLEFSLQKKGYITATAGDGASACQIIECLRPKVVLLDILIPALDGWDVCRKIRTHHDPGVAETSIIMITALTGSENRLKAVEYGADIYISKPYNTKEIVMHVANLISKQKNNYLLKKNLENLRKKLLFQQNITSSVVHEIKNQLPIIAGSSRRLLSIGSQSSWEKLQQHLQAIHTSSSYLEAIIEEHFVLRQAQEKKGGLPINEVDLCALLNELEHLYKKAASLKKIRLDIQLPEKKLVIASNKFALQLVLSNLIENSIKYAGDNSIVKVLCSKLSKSSFQIKVSDNGKGISTEDQSRVFEQFYRGDKAAGNSSGNGLGLYIVQALVEALGGQIELKSSPDKGCEFCMSFRQYTGKQAKAWC